MRQKLAFIYPAFVLKYTGKEVSVLERNKVPFSEKLLEVSNYTGDDFSDFDIVNNSFLNDELKNQYLSYIFSCTFSDILKENRFDADYIAGFSMGLYAALYKAGSIDFKTGALIIKDVFYTIKDILAGKNFSMASVIGFSKEDINIYLQKFSSIECVVQNGEHSFVLSGPEKDMGSALEFFQEEGAIHLSKFSVSCPYHSSVLSPFRSLFEKLLEKYTINDAIIPIISFIDNRQISTAGELKEEIVKNIISPLNFYNSIIFLQEQGVKRIIEVGPGDSLTKSSKFIEGDFEFEAFAKGKVL
jgi:malonyl CoA-acyl carrier protein transacylase